MTDITELAQGKSLRKKLNRRLNDALGFQRTSGGKHTTISLSIDECKSIIAALDERLALAEALEKAQPAPVVPTFEEWCKRTDQKPQGWVRDAMKEAYDGAAAAMLQAGNSPVIPDGLIGAVNRLLDSDGSRGCYSAIRCGDAHDEIERLLAASPQEVSDGK